MNAKAYLELLRPLNCVVAAIGTYAGFAVSFRAFSFSWQIALLMASAFLVCGGGQAVNDYFDRLVDQKLHPKKPIPSRRVSAKSGLLFAGLLFLLGIILSGLVNQNAFAIALAFSVLLIAYSAFFAKFKWIGNWIVALGTGFTLVFGASIVENYSVVLVLALSAVLANVFREISKDFEDIGADRGFKVSLPMVCPKSLAKWFAIAILGLAIIVSYLPYIMKKFGNIYFLVLVTIANLVFIACAFLLAKNNYKKAQSLSKVAMIIALLGFLSGAA